VAEPQEIHQIEYRWQPAKDMSAVASSMSPDSDRLWIQRIGPWVRHPGVDAPTDSVRYEIFGNGIAALAWRQRDRQAVEFEDGREGRPLVSRVLLGAADMLTPEVAVVVCSTGLPGMIGPRPGTVPVGAQLPTVDAAGLTRFALDKFAALDEAAAQEPGLEQVISAALSDRDTPLSVQLPERLILRSPRGGAQALLLWGLRRTVWPLLGRSGGRRGWSFSSFELPQSDMDPGTLPAIVFRLAQPTPQTAPMTMRKEFLVRPYDPVPRPVEPLHQQLARLLVAAYQDQGGDALSRLIVSCAGEYPSADRRIEAVYGVLDKSEPAVTVASDGPRFVPTRTSAVPDDSTRVDTTVPPACAPPEDVSGKAGARPVQVSQPVSPQPLVHGTSPQPPAPAAPPERRNPEPPRTQPEPPHVRQEPARTQPDSSRVTPFSPPPSAPPREPRAPRPVPDTPPPVASPPPAARPAASPSEPRQEAPRLFTGDERHGPATETSASATLTALLALLSAGPASQGFEPALQALRAENFQTGPDERASARKLLCERGWYVDVLGQYDQARFEDILVMIFWHTVIPDLAHPQVGHEIAGWASERAAPATVIRALYAAAEGTAGAQPMGQALGPVLAWRWLTDHGINVSPIARPPVAAWPAAGEPAGPARDPSYAVQDAGSSAQGMAPQAAARRAGDRHTLPSVLDRQVTMPVPLVLAIGIAVIVLLVFWPR
jgi:hypothetical protein